MKKFAKPVVGTVVTLTTRHKETYIHTDSEWCDTAYQNVSVLAPELWFGPSDIKVSSGDSQIPFRVINMRNVIALSDGVTEEMDTTMCTIPIQGSKGNEYYVTVYEGEATTCTCPGFTYRRKCRHLSDAVDLIHETLEHRVHIKGKTTPNVGQSHLGERDMKTFTWGQRFALIEAFKPSDLVACAALGVSQEELAAARNLQTAGTITVDKKFNTKSHADIFKGVKALAVPTKVIKTVKKTTAKVSTTKKIVKKVALPVSATKPIYVPKKRGRKGAKITTAFAAIPTTPTDAEKFARQHSVSLAVLRQSKRFDKNSTGIVKVRKDREKGVLMVWREANTANTANTTV